MDSPVIPVEFRAIRYVRDLRGGTPSITHSINRTTRSLESSKYDRRMIDRVLSLTTANAISTEYLYVANCDKANIQCGSVTGQTTAAVLKLQGCNGDPSIAGNWYDIP